MDRKFKLVCPLLLTVAGFALDTTVVKESGTVVVVGLSKNKIVIAADSRGNYGSGKYDDHVCKIVELSDKFVFATSGRAGLLGVQTSNSPEPIGVLDTREEAKLAFASIPPSSEDFLANVAVAWGRHVQRIFRQDISLAGAKPVIGDLPQGPIARGIFLGVSAKGDLIGYMETIYRQGNDVSLDPIPQILPLADTMNYVVSGIVDTVGELRDGKLDWVKQETTQWERQSAAWPEDERDILKAIRWVDLTLAAHPRSNEIGGPIDSIIIKPVSGVRWGTRKPECPAEN